jgi:L-threonylcarbamoyladenylate synthase
VEFPIIGTSANISGQKSLLNPQEIFETFQKQNFKPDFVLDFKTLPESKSSTIIDITKKQPQIIRQGDVDSKKLLNLWQLND